MIDYLSKVPVKKHVYKIDDYRVCDYAIGMILSKSSVNGRYDRKSAGYTLNKTEKAIYYIADNFYTYTADGNLNVYNGKTSSVLCSMGATTPVAVKVKVQGQEKALFIGEKSYLIDGTATLVNLPATETAIQHNGRLFMATGKVINFSSPFDFDNCSVVFDQYGFIEVEKDAGDIVGFLSRNDLLYVFCQRAIYALETCIETLDFKLKRLKYDNLNIAQNSVAVENGVAVFVNDKSVCLFDGSTIKKLSVYFDNTVQSVLGKASLYNGIYSAPVKLRQTQHMYVLSINDGRECAFDYINLPLLSGPYHSYGAYVYTLYENPAFYGGFSYLLENLDFSDVDYKILNEISITVGCACTISISGDFGYKTFSLKAGLNQIKTNLPSKKFRLEITGAGSNFNIKGLTLTYSKRGE